VYVGCFTNDFESVGGRDPCKNPKSFVLGLVLTIAAVGGPFYAATGYGARYVSLSIDMDTKSKSWHF
jgi:hypothetical protein